MLPCIPSDDPAEQGSALEQNFGFCDSTLNRTMDTALLSTSGRYTQYRARSSVGVTVGVWIGVAEGVRVGVGVMDAVAVTVGVTLGAPVSRPM